jgi:hypothetical protein
MGICIEAIWNYQTLFFLICSGYNFYSNFICIGSVINLYYEKAVSLLIILCGYFASQAAVSLYSSPGGHFSLVDSAAINIG